jgi:hypothetical protein
MVAGALMKVLRLDWSVDVAGARALIEYLKTL